MTGFVRYRVWPTATTGQRLQARRKELKLTQQQLAEAVGITSWSLSMYETDQGSPSFETAIKLADVLGVSLDYLARRTTDPTMIGGDGRDHTIR